MNAENEWLFRRYEIPKRKTNTQALEFSEHLNEAKFWKTRQKMKT